MMKKPLIIVIIALVVGVIFWVYVQSNRPQFGYTSLSGYYFVSPTMNTTGTLEFVLGQPTNTTEYNIGLACAAVSNSNGLPYTNSSTANAFYYPTSNGSVVSNYTPAQSNMLSLAPRQQIFVKNLPCWGYTGKLIGNTPIGSSFGGSLWINYTQSPGAPSESNPWHTVKIATILIRTN